MSPPTLDLRRDGCIKVSPHRIYLILHLRYNLFGRATSCWKMSRKLRDVIGQKARQYKYTPMIGRSHGIHAEPITFGLKMALMYDEFGRGEYRLRAARQEVAVGKLSGAVGTHAHLDPRVEATVCEKLGLKPDPLSTQVIQRDRHGQFSAESGGGSVQHRSVGDRVPASAANRSAGIGGVFQSGPERKFCDAAQKESDYGRTAEWARAGNPWKCGGRIRKCSVVARAGHQPQQRGTIILPDSCILMDYMLATLAELVAGLQIYPENMQENLEITKGLYFSQTYLVGTHATRTRTQACLRSRSASRDGDLARLD